MNPPVVAEFLGHLFRASWQASVLAIVVWLVIKALGDHLDARWRCRLWMLVIARLAWPVSLPSPVSLFNWVGTPPGFEAPNEVLEGAYGPSIAMVRFLESAWVQWIWGIIAALLLARALAGGAWAVWVRWGARPLDSWDAWWLLQRCKEVSGLEASVAIMESSAVQSPCLLGIWRPKLVLPQGLIRDLSHPELRMVFLHELAHLRRRDLAFNWLLAAVELIHWFNPLVWFVTRQVRADREEDCDARALETEPTARRTYGEIIIKLLDYVAAPAGPMAATSQGSSTVNMLGDGDADIRPLLHRMQAIKRFRPGARTWLVGFCTWLAIALVGFTDAEPGPPIELTALHTVEWVNSRV